MSLGFSQFKAGEGVYVLVAFVPEGCKQEVDGHYIVSKDGTVSFPFMDARIHFDKGIEDVRKDLRRAIADYSRKKFPDEWARRNLSAPRITIVPDTKVSEAGEGVMVVGEVRKPGIQNIKDGLTVYGALANAGGATEFSTMGYTSILRKNKTIDCDLTDPESMRIQLKPGDVIVVPLKCWFGDTDFTRRKPEANKPEMATPNKPTD